MFGAGIGLILPRRPSRWGGIVNEAGASGSIKPPRGERGNPRPLWCVRPPV